MRFLLFRHFKAGSEIEGFDPLPTTKKIALPISVDIEHGSPPSAIFLTHFLLDEVADLQQCPVERHATLQKPHPWIMSRTALTICAALCRRFA